MKISVILLFFITVLFSCSKDTSESCGSDKKISRTIKDQSATVRIISGVSYIIEDLTIDTRLIPCLLTEEFNKDGLRILFSGQTWVETPGKVHVCCTLYLKIDSIRKL